MPKFFSSPNFFVPLYNQRRDLACCSALSLSFPCFSQFFPVFLHYFPGHSLSAFGVPQTRRFGVIISITLTLVKFIFGYKNIQQNTDLLASSLHQTFVIDYFPNVKKILLQSCKQHKSCNFFYKQRARPK